MQAMTSNIRLPDELGQDIQARRRALKLSKVELASSALKLGQPDPSEEGHADIDGSFEFNCADATKAAFIDVGLFEFKRMQRLEVQVAAPKGQFKRDLKRPAARIVLTK